MRNYYQKYSHLGASAHMPTKLCQEFCRAHAVELISLQKGVSYHPCIWGAHRERNNSKYLIFKKVNSNLPSSGENRKQWATKVLKEVWALFSITFGTSTEDFIRAHRFMASKCVYPEFSSELSNLGSSIM